MNRIMFPKPETEIVNKLLRLRRAIVDLMQIRSKQFRASSLRSVTAWL